MFVGTHSPRLDDKGRLFLPAKVRDQLAEGLVITPGHERCLNVWPVAAFAELTAPMGRAPQSNKKARDYQRMLFASAAREVPDRQGRITLPAALRAYAGLERDCVVIGANTHVEIWETGAWQRYSAEQEQVFATLEEEVLPGVF